VSRFTLPHCHPAQATGAALAASGITVFLAPFLAYAAAGAASGYPGTGAVVGLFLVPFFPMVAPLHFGFLFLCSAAIGCLLVLGGARHIAYFVLAGAALAVLAWALEPVLIGLGKRPPFLAKNSDAIHTALVICSMAGPGALNGVIYWFLMGKFSQPKPLTMAEKRPDA
jgi:hypothetical protein